MSQKEQATGQLFGKLFPAYDQASYKHSVELFERRLAENDVPLDWFQGKTCLDVGCGGGRYSIALAKLGAAHCTGIDLAEPSIQDARRRAAELGVDNLEFRVGSATSLPFEDASFDCVLFSGVLQHVGKPITVLNELARVTRSGGMVYMLVYATEGLRWPAIQMLRPIAQTVGFEAMDEAIAAAGLPVNKRRTYLDDLFVPFIDFYSESCLTDLLQDKGFEKVERWKKGRLDHEESLEDYARDLDGLLQLFAAAAKTLESRGDAHAQLVREGEVLCRSVTKHLQAIQSMVTSGTLSEAQGRELAIGQGHHRVVAWKA